MVPSDQSDPAELRVLSALTAGASTATGVAGEIGEPESVVAPILEQAVADEVAVQLDLPGLPTYALTPQGLALLGVAPPGPSAAPELEAPPSPSSGPSAPSAPGAPGAPVSQSAAGAPSAPTTDTPGSGYGATPADQPRPTVVRRHLVYAALYVVVGLFLALFLAPVVGVLAIAGGLVLAGFALRPLYAGGRASVNDR